MASLSSTARGWREVTAAAPYRAATAPSRVGLQLQHVGAVAEALRAPERERVRIRGLDPHGDAAAALGEERARERDQGGRRAPASPGGLDPQLVDPAHGRTVAAPRGLLGLREGEADRLPRGERQPDRAAAPREPAVDLGLQAQAQRAGHGIAGIEPAVVVDQPDPEGQQYLALGRERTPDLDLLGHCRLTMARK